VQLFIGNNECVKEPYYSSDVQFVCYTPPAPGGKFRLERHMRLRQTGLSRSPFATGVGSIQQVAMYVKGINEDFSQASCDYYTCQFTYASQYTPSAWGYSSLSGSGGARPTCTAPTARSTV